MNRSVNQTLVLASLLMAASSTLRAEPVRNSIVVHDTVEVSGPSEEVIRPNTPADTPLYLINHFFPGAGLCARPVLAPDGHQVTLAEWKRGRGTAQLECHPEGTKVDLSISGLLPNGLYTIWVAYQDQAIDPDNLDSYVAVQALGATDGTQNTFRASATGQGQLSVIHPAGPLLLAPAGPDPVGLVDCLLNEPQILDRPERKFLLTIRCDYHVDDKEYGPIPGVQCTYAIPFFWEFEPGQLKIEKAATISWLGAGKPQLLEGSQAAEGPWRPVPQPPSLLEGSYRLTVSAAQGHQLFRLRTVDALSSTVEPIASEIGDRTGQPLAADASLASPLYIRQTDCHPPMLAPDGHQVTLAEWNGVRGTAALACLNDGTKIDLALTGLIPNGLYTMAVIIKDPANLQTIGTGVLGPNDGSKNTIVASASGEGYLSLTHPPGDLSVNGRVGKCLLDGSLVWLVGTYHVDQKTWGKLPAPPCTQAAQFRWAFQKK